jgi:cell division protein FtsX
MHTPTLAALNSNELTLIIVAIAVGGGITLVSLFINLVQNIHRTRQTEQSRREIAAYVAEGSMTPEDGERLIKAGREQPKPWWADGGAWWNSCGSKKT